MLGRTARTLDYEDIGSQVVESLGIENPLINQFRRILMNQGAEAIKQCDEPGWYTAQCEILRSAQSVTSLYDNQGPWKLRRLVALSLY